MTLLHHGSQRYLVFGTVTNLKLVRTNCSGCGRRDRNFNFASLQSIWISSLSIKMTTLV
jgi:hypothetical protein